MAPSISDNPLSGHYATIVGAVFDPEVRATPGGVQMYVWQSLNNHYLARGEPLPAGSFQAVNQLLSLAGQQRAAQLNLSQALASFNRTGVDSMLAANHISPAIDARGAGERALGAQYRLIYENHYLINGQEVVKTETHDLGFELPQSLTQLQVDAEFAGQLMAADYEFEWAGVAIPVGIQSY